jgi:hypothetical protein
MVRFFWVNKEIPLYAENCRRESGRETRAVSNAHLSEWRSLIGKKPFRLSLLYSKLTQHNGVQGLSWHPAKEIT